MPFSNYSATVRIIDNGDGTSTVDWVGTFEPRGVEEADAINMATGIYAGAIKRRADRPRVWTAEPGNDVTLKACE